MLGDPLPVANPQLLGDVAHLLHVVLRQLHSPALPVLLQPVNVLGLGNDPDPPVQAGLQGYLSRRLIMLGTELQNDVVL